MASPQVSADRPHGDVDAPFPVPVKEEEPAAERVETEVQLCVEESSAMTPSEELHSSDSASFPSLTDDDITDDITANDVTTNDITTNDVTTNDVTTNDVTTNDVTTNDVTTNDVTTNDVTTNDVTTNDVTTDDITTDDITTVGGVMPEPTLRANETTDFTGRAAVAPPSSLIATPPLTSDTLTSFEAPPTSAETAPTSTETPPPVPLTTPPSITPPPALVSTPLAAVAPPSADLAPPTSSTVTPVSSSAPSTSAPPPQQGAGPQEVYLVKWITWKEKRTPIITQSQNGPCPLLAIMNTLFLRWKAKLPAQTEVVTTEDLMTHLGECVLSVTPREKSKGVELNFQQNMSDAMAVLPKLCTGLDVNVRFTGVSDFEYTPECIVFDLLDIPLYHGWLLDPQSPETVAAVGKLTYNQLVEKIIDCKHSAESSKVSEGLVAEQFLESTASQLSYHGLCELTSRVREGEVSVFFRNNHFSTVTKNQATLYLLVTDQGFQSEERLVWESLHNVEGDGNFCDSDFRLFQKSQDYNQTTAAQIDQDFLVAVSLQQSGGDPVSLSDAELAQQLQQEEYQQQQQQQQQQPSAAPSSTQPARGQSSQSGRRRDKDSDCVVL
ncbi:ubiquitin carboxyl-terminal hydrolase MINDY-1 [Eucyclogobius newberryi]|uniref:ubiquitin carboxyl-terminal hydrolase MINDY-1 n=1 Tax=Eucyclogobius newberryi TaxID=166745 RepID=UPI003B5BA38B